MRGLCGSASLKTGVLTLSVVNPHATLPVEAALDVEGGSMTEATVSVLTHSDLAAHNTFESPDHLRPTTQPWTPEDRYVFPPASVTVIRARIG